MIPNIFSFIMLREKQEKKRGWSRVKVVGTKHIPDSEQRSVQPCSADYFHCAPAGGYFTQPRPLRLPGLFFGVAELLQIAAVAFGFAGVADLAAVVDDLVGEADPAALGDDSHQLLLDFLGRVA